MRPLKILGIAVVAYVAIVVLFESMIGVLQPQSDSTLTLTTFDADGTPNPRVLASLESGGQLYVAANHWPRAWYHRALENPDVRVELKDETSERRAVQVGESERARVDAEHALVLPFRFVTGFPPRHFLRLDPKKG